MFDAGIAYRLAPRQRLRFQYSWNRTEGYFGQDSIFASAFYDYQLYRNIALSAAYRFRDVRNLDSNATGELTGRRASTSSSPSPSPPKPSGGRERTELAIASGTC